MTLRARILLLSVGLTTVVLVLFAVPLAIALKQSASDRVTRGTEYVAQGVADYLSTSDHSSAERGEYVDRVNARSSTAITVLLADGTQLGAALPEGLPGTSPPRDDDRDADEDSADLGKVTQPRVMRTADGWVVDITSSNSTGGALVRAYVSDEDVDHEVYERWSFIGGGALLLLLLAAGAAEIVSRRLTRPLVATAATAAQISGGDLEARAPVGGANEISKVAAALNELAERIEGLLASERETIADLSHRLRTPMTAIRLDVESLPDSERTRDLARHVGVLERTLTAVIQHARLPHGERVSPRCDAATVVRERIEFWSALAEDQGRTVTKTVHDLSFAVGCTSDDLAAAVDALLENAIAHTPEGTPLGIELLDIGGVGRLDIIDHGPGIPAGATRRGRSDRGSSGLGLDIARSCAESTGGRLDVLREEGVTVVRLELCRANDEI